MDNSPALPALPSGNRESDLLANGLPSSWLSLRHVETVPAIALLSGHLADLWAVTVMLPRRLAPLLMPIRTVIDDVDTRHPIRIDARKHDEGGDGEDVEISVRADGDPDLKGATLVLTFSADPDVPKDALIASLGTHCRVFTTSATALPSLAWLFDPDESQAKMALRNNLGRAKRDLARQQAAHRTVAEQDRHRRVALDLRDVAQALEASRAERGRLALELEQAKAESLALSQSLTTVSERLARESEENGAMRATLASIRPGLFQRLRRRLTFTPPAPPPPLPVPPETIIPSGEAGEAAGSTPASPGQRRRALFVAGEPETPGVTYRCTRLAEAARDAGYDARVKPCAAVDGADVMWADILVLWRVEFSGHVDILIRLARERGAVIVFDADDIVFVPHFARIEIIDGIRSIGATEERIERMFSDMRRTMMRCDLGLATTRELADAMRVNLTHTEQVPNSYDAAALASARLARRTRAFEADGLTRIGYATGSRTHQRDFARISGAIANVLHLRPDVRLVLFREAENKRPVLLMEEFPELEAVAGQIEWRDMVPLEHLPAEFARLDISIAPLETGNPFCEAKSEIKYVEPALAGAVCVASPTGPFRRAIRDGETGVLADTPDAWQHALLALIDDPGRRRTMARDAYHDVLWPFGPAAQAQRLRTILDGLGQGREIMAALSAETSLARSVRPRPDLPVIAPSETLYTQDRLAQADVTVVITLYNYAAFIVDALDSVRDQTLEILDLIVVDDGSTDESAALARLWMERNANRFNRLILLRTLRNVGLGGARNVGMDAAETPYVMQLDADNRLHPEACALLRDAMAEPGEAGGPIGYAYPTLRMEDDKGTLRADAPAGDLGGAGGPALLGDLAFAPMRLIGGNHVDAMAMVAKWAWAAVGGYYVEREAMGWEDYDLWCGLAEIGVAGRHVDAVLATYRCHAGSMTNGVTERARHKARVVDVVTRRHPWIRLVAAEARQRQ